MKDTEQEKEEIGLQSVQQSAQTETLNHAATLD